jgi:hypothetical protein
MTWHLHRWPNIYFTIRTSFVVLVYKYQAYTIPHLYKRVGGEILGHTKSLTIEDKSLKNRFWGVSALWWNQRYEISKNASLI